MPSHDRASLLVTYSMQASWTFHAAAPRSLAVAIRRRTTSTTVLTPSSRKHSAMSTIDSDTQLRVLTSTESSSSATGGRHTAAHTERHLNPRSFLASALPAVNIANAPSST